MTRIVFLGTPDAAVPTLRSLNQEFEVGLVITQPDRPRGRSKKPIPSPISDVADQLDLVVAKPDSPEDLLGALNGYGPFDLGAVVAYGRILSSEVLEGPNHGMLNLHFSLLPRWRGAAPVARALMAGDTMTGATIIRIDQGLDTGDVLTAQAIDVQPNEDAGSLTHRLSEIGASLVVNSIEGYLSGSIEPVPQSDEGLTYASKLTPADRRLSTELSPGELVNRVRGLAPRPGATMQFEDETVKVLVAAASEADVEPGTWRDISGNPVVGVSGGSVEVLQLQPPGKKAMSGSAWLRGRPSTGGSVR